MERPVTERRVKVPCFIQFIVIVLVFALLIFGAYEGYQRSQASTLTLPTNAIVVTSIQHISKLETVTYTLQQIIAYDPHPNSIWNFLGDPKKLFVVYGTSTAGFDFAKITANDIQRQTKNNKTTITLTMPPPEILNTAIDPTHTRVYDANSGVFSGLEDQGMDPNTTVQILSAGQKELLSEACQDGILQQASNSAQVQLTSFLTNLGFSSATVNIPTGTCG